MTSLRHVSSACVLILACAAVALVAPTRATASPGGGPHWLASVQAAPSYFKAGSAGDFYEVLAENDGTRPTSGEVKLIDELPADATVTAYSAHSESEGERIGALVHKMTCNAVSHSITCSTTTSIPAGGFLVAKINVDISGDASGQLEDAVTLAGGEAAEAHASVLTPVSAEAVPYGASIVSEVPDEDGEEATQAGSRPLSFTSLLRFAIGPINPLEKCSETAGCGEVVANTRDVEVALPAGLVGDPSAVPLCPQADFQEKTNEGCPAGSQVGDALLIFGSSATTRQYAPIYDVEPPPGEPAELGFTIGSLAHVPIFFHIRTEGDYGVTADIPELSEFDPITAAAITLWGVPSESVHDRLREGIECESAGGGCAGGSEAKPFLTLPTSCSDSGLELGLGSDSWQQPLATPLPTIETETLAGTTGCASLPFAPSIEAQPETMQAGAPTGYEVKLEVPQHEGVNEDATAQVRDAQVTLPAGTVISASSAKGLVACPEASFAPKAKSLHGCPPASIVGSVKIVTPLISTPLTGSVYIGEPECDPCDPAQAQEGKLLRLYLEAQGSGIVVKLIGATSISQADGELTTTFDEDPQLPFSEVLVTIEGGADAPLANGSDCSAQSTTAQLTPWSGSPPASVASAAEALTGCGPASFSPGFEAGVTGSTQAGAFSGFLASVTRPAGQQQLGKVVMHTPPGLIAKLSSVPRCGGPEANDGTCSAASEIGTASVLAGPGSDPLAISGGRVYLTGPYEGAPFGLSIVIPATIGPFQLAGENGEDGPGDGSVVLRASVALDPRTTALTIATSSLPTELDGIPLEADKLVVDLDREGFVLNPTDCDATSIDATISSTGATTATDSYPFQVSGCTKLSFAPKLSVSTHAGHTHKDGDYFGVKVKTRAGEANVRKIHVTLPGRLPARLSTLKLACTEAQFAANPAGCPPGSIVGMAKADTAVLPAPLTGPAIFVSHGGTEFPNLDLVLQGEGVTILLEGDTFINPEKITSSTFHEIPDVPVRTFEVTLPQGEDSALAGNGNLCSKPLRMPTTITGQNGAVVEEDIKVAVRGCKPQIEVVSHRVHGAAAIIAVKVPSAGRLIARGTGLIGVRKHVARAKTARLEVHLTPRDRRALAGQRGRRLRVLVKLRFKPAHGNELGSRVTLLMS